MGAIVRRTIIWGPFSSAAIVRRVGHYTGAIILGSNYPRGNYPRGQLSGGKLSGEQSSFHHLIIPGRISNSTTDVPT